MAFRRLPKWLKKNPQIAIIILSMHSDEAYLMRTLAAGAKGYLLKESADADLDRAIKSVARGKPYFSPESQILCWRITSANFGKEACKILMTC